MVALPSSITLACPLCGADLDVPLQLGPLVEGSTTLSGDVRTARAHLRAHQDGEQQMDEAQRPPEVGSHVHYRSYGTPDGEYVPECRDAIVRAVPDSLTCEPYDGCPNGKDGNWAVSLAIFTPEGKGVFFNAACPSGDEGGSWHWPEGAASGPATVHVQLVADSDRLEADMTVLARALSRAAKTQRLA